MNILLLLYFERNFIIDEILPLYFMTVTYSFKISLVLVTWLCLWRASCESAVRWGNLILPLFGFHDMSTGGSSAESLSRSPDGSKSMLGGFNSGAGEVSLLVLFRCSFGRAPLCSRLARLETPPSFDFPLSSSSLLPSVNNSSPDIHWSSSS